ANVNRSLFDFYSPDTFNYAMLNFSPDGSTLDVSFEGINSYAANIFPEAGATSDLREIFGFTLSSVPSPSAVALLAGGGRIAGGGGAGAGVGETVWRGILPAGGGGARRWAFFRAEGER